MQTKLEVNTVRVGQYSLKVYPLDVEPSSIPECYRVLYKSPFSVITEDDIQKLIAETRAIHTLKCLPNCVQCPLALEDKLNADKV